MFGTAHTEVLIVGAGPVGLFAAVLLAERGIEVTIIDRERRTNMHSYALALHPDTLRMLEDLNLLGELRRNGQVVRSVGYYTGSTNRLTVRLSDVDTSHPWVLAVPQSTLENVLEKRLHDKGISVQWQHELADLYDDGKGPIAEVHHVGDVPQGYPVLHAQRMVLSRRKVHAQFVLGADGYQSTVRRAIGSEYTDRGAPEFYSLYEFSTSATLDDELRIAVHPDGVGYLWPLAHGRCRWGFSINNPQQHGATLQDLCRLVHERAPWFEGLPKSVDWSGCVRFERRLATHFGKGRLWLAGDSAHLTTPIAAQSMNAGLREAYELSWRFFEVLRNVREMDVFEQYERERQTEWHHLHASANHIKPVNSASPFATENAALILSSLPATGPTLARLLEQACLRVD